MNKIKAVIIFIAVISGVYGLTSFVSNSFAGETEVSAVQNNSIVPEVHWQNPPVEVKHHFLPNNCTSCHFQLEHIRAEESGMMQEILEISDKASAPRK